MGLRFPLLVVCLFVPLLSWANAISFSSVDIQGKTHSLEDYKGKWVVVNYWATWCPPCLDEIPELNEFHEEHHKKDAVVLGINFEEVDKDYLKSFIDEYFISYPVFIGELKRNSPFGQIIGLPTTFIVSPEGKVVERKVGGITKQWIESIMQQRKASQELLKVQSYNENL